MLFADDFEAFAIAYGEMFTQVNLFPKAVTILSATSQVNNQNAARTALELYTAAMRVEVNQDKGYVKRDQVEIHHAKATQNALALFDKRATMGVKDKITACREKLLKDIEEVHASIVEENESRNVLAKIEKYYVGE